MATDLASSSMNFSSLSGQSFSLLTGLKNSYVDIFDQGDGLLVFVLQPTTSFSRKKPAHQRSGSGPPTALPSPSLPVGSFSSSAIPTTSDLPMKSLVRPYKSGSQILSESVPAERLSRLAESQASSGQGNLSNEVAVIDFKNDEIEFHEELGRGASGAVVYACSIKGASLLSGKSLGLRSDNDKCIQVCSLRQKSWTAAHSQVMSRFNECFQKLGVCLINRIESFASNLYLLA